MKYFNDGVRCYSEIFKSINIIVVVNVIYKLISLLESKINFTVCRLRCLKCL